MSPGRGWIRALGLFMVVAVASVAQPPVLVALPFLVMAAVLGVRRPASFAALGIALVLAVAWGPWDGIGYVERAWALVLGGWFTALTLRHPGVRFTTRAFGAVAGAAATVSAIVAARGHAWNVVDWAVRDRMSRGVSAALETFRAMRGGHAVSPALASALDETVRAQTVVFPALLGLASVAALGVAWWMYVRLDRRDDGGIGSLSEFRFNDHLVWIFIGGLVLLVVRWGDALGRVGSNAVVFMGALYALRGVAVVLFLSGGLSLLGMILLVFGLVFVPPVLLAGAMIIGLGDTWLDIRARAAGS
jgi:hypothetical protein